MTKYTNANNFSGLSPFIVSSTAGQGSYSTIQAAINAANAAGGGTVYIDVGTYTENLTLYGNISLIGAMAPGQATVTIIGNHTATNWVGVIGFENIYMRVDSGTLLTFTTNSASSDNINITNCYIRARATAKALALTVTAPAALSLTKQHPT